MPLFRYYVQHEAEDSLVFELEEPKMFLNALKTKSKNKIKNCQALIHVLRWFDMTITMVQKLWMLHEKSLIFIF